MENKVKSELRKEMKAYRAGLDRKQKQQMDHAIWTHFFELQKVQEAQHFFVYASFGTEIDTLSLMEKLWKAGKRVYAPRVNGKEMDFYEITSMQDLKKGYREILEPVEQLVPVRGLSGVMIMPGLAFDRKGHRIGYGGGFYDRYIARQKNDCYKIAVAYQKQVWPFIATQEYDQTADCIVTEQEIIWQDT